MFLSIGWNFTLRAPYNANAFTSSAHSPAGSPIDKSSNCLSKLEFLLGSHMTRELICCNETERRGDRIKFWFWSHAESHLDPRLKAV